MSDNQKIVNNAQSELELSCATHDGVEPWRDTQTPNRLTSAFQIGRLLNQLSWHLQKVLFGSSADKSGADEVLSALEGISYQFVDEPPNLLRDVINDLRRNYQSRLCGEGASDDVACLVDRESYAGGHSDEEDPRQVLVETWVYPLLRPVRECIWEKLTITERWALELGLCLDDGMRNSGLYRFIEARRYVRHGYYANDHDRSESRWGVCGVEVRSFQPGELEVDTAWPHALRALLAKVGMPAASFETTLSQWEQAESQDQKSSSMPRTLELLDRSIREYLGACNDDSDGTKPQGPTTITYGPCKEIGGELPLSPVRVDGQPEAEQPRAEQTANQSTIPDERLSRVMNKKEAARYHAGSGVENPTVYLKRLTRKGLLSAPIGSGQSWRFDVQDFPENVRDEMRRSEKTKPQQI